MGSENSKEANVSEQHNYNEIFKKYSPYKILGVSTEDSLEDIVKKYKALCRQHHPDKGGDLKKFNLIKEAYSHVSLVHQNRQFTHDNIKKKFAKDLEQIDENTKQLFYKQGQLNLEKDTENKRNIDSSANVYNDANESCDAINYDIQRGKSCRKKSGDKNDYENENETTGRTTKTISNFENKFVYEDESDFNKKFNKVFDKSFLASENQSYGYGNIDWSKYDSMGKKYEMIPYEMIHFNYSKNVNCEQFDNSSVTDYSKYPTMNDRDLNYTDFMQAYTNCATLLPDDHEVIWNEYFKDYHNRDMKKIETQRDEKPTLTDHEIMLNNKRLEKIEENEKERIANWNNWVEKQRQHYEKANVCAIKNN
jgi:curved DNA-binding protein CbpA